MPRITKKKQDNSFTTREVMLLCVFAIGVGYMGAFLSSDPRVPTTDSLLRMEESYAVGGGGGDDLNNVADDGGGDQYNMGSRSGGRSGGGGDPNDGNKNVVNANYGSTAAVAQRPSGVVTPRQPPLQQLENFMRRNPAAPATVFVKLLRQYLHFEPNAEAIRMDACRYKSRKTSICFGGVGNYRRTEQQVMKEFGTNKTAATKLLSNQTEVEMRTKLPLYEKERFRQKDPYRNTVYALRHYRDKDYLIPNLGTKAVCLPLLLAASTINEPNSMVVELGPFVGLSSKCILYGLAKNGLGFQDNMYRAFDIFDGPKNFKVLQTAGWVKLTHPSITEKKSNFYALWKDSVHFVYPKADATPGLLKKDSLSPSKLKNKDVKMISIDCAKSAKHLKDWLGGIPTLKKGSILFLLDFDFVREQVKQVYGCFRRSHLLPVYVSWNMEHWAFIVLEDFTIEDAAFKRCYKAIAENVAPMVTEMKRVVEHDLLFLSGLTNDGATNKHFQALREKLQQSTYGQLENSPEEWTRLANLYY